MKYIVIVPDGVADYPLAELNGQTPLEYARTPHLDTLAREGLVGLVQTIPEGFAPGSDIGNLSCLGYNPRKCFSGRAPLEAANLGIELAENEIVFRCNLVTVVNNLMEDYSAGHISSQEAAALMETLNHRFGSPTLRFHAGKSYRHLLVLKTPQASVLAKLNCTPPHDILNQPITAFLPSGEGETLIRTLMESSQQVLSDHPINHRRRSENQNPASMIWLWGQGVKPHLQTFKDKFGIGGSVISAVDLVNGIGKMAGLEIITVPGVTGYYDTNYHGKGSYALASLKDHDFVFIHVEATDEASHNGDLKMKIHCAELIDQQIVSQVLEYARHHEQVRVLVLPDHFTPVAKRTHTGDPVCFTMFGSGFATNNRRSFCEREARSSGFFFPSGEDLMQYFIAHHQ